MDRRPHTPIIILAGLFLAQLVGTLQVHLSNARLFRTVEAVKSAGYLAIPNDLAAPLLETFKAAFMGGTFFTLSIGTGMTLLSLACVWVWKYICRRNRYLAILLLLPWLFFLVGINARGISLMPSLYGTLVPVLTALLALKMTPDTLSRTGWTRGVIHAVVIVVLAAVWMSQTGGSMFINIRDNLLLTNPVGVGINDFYYRYTLYPAEAFKSLQQKMIKTCHIEELGDPSMQKKLAAGLARKNYLSIEKNHDVDLTVTQTGGTLELKHGKNIVIETSLKKFVDRPGPILKSFSKKCDRHIFFRQLTFLSLLIAFPLTLYFLVYAMLFWITGFFMKPVKAGILAGVICLVAGILMALPVYTGKQPQVAPDHAPTLLNSAKWREQVAALKIMADNKQLWVYTAENQTLASSPHIPVRYWLARALSHSKGELTHTTLIRLMDDPQPIVSCQALYSLGVRKKRPGVNVILDKIKRSDHWYVQWYAYNALKVLGWRQKISN